MVLWWSEMDNYYSKKWEGVGLGTFKSIGACKKLCKEYKLWTTSVVKCFDLNWYYIFNRKVLVVQLGKVATVERKVPNRILRAVVSCGTL